MINTSILIEQKEKIKQMQQLNVEMIICRSISMSLDVFVLSLVEIHIFFQSNVTVPQNLL